jgi:hypothetical protein
VGAKSRVLTSRVCISKVGRTAPEEFLTFLEGLANTHHPSMFVDVIRAYHFGQRFIVEAEVVSAGLNSVCCPCTGV